MCYNNCSQQCGFQRCNNAYRNPQFSFFQAFIILISLYLLLRFYGKNDNDIPQERAKYRTSSVNTKYKSDGLIYTIHYNNAQNERITTKAKMIENDDLQKAFILLPTATERD